MNFCQNTTHNITVKKFVKICLITISLGITFALCFGATYVTLNYFSYSRIPLNAEALSSNNAEVQIFDFENKPIKQPTQQKHMKQNSFLLNIWQVILKAI